MNLHGVLSGSASPPRPLVLMYHCVNEERSDPWEMCVTPKHFDEHLQVIREQLKPMPLPTVVELLQSKSLPTEAAAITFDDGYADNLHHAAPLLERHAVPATVFITSEAISGHTEFWWDELERIFLQSPVLPDRLNLAINGREYQWSFSAVPPRAAAVQQRWRAWEEAPTKCHAAYRALWEIIQPLDAEPRQETMNQLLDWAKQDSTVRPTHRRLTSTELVDLSRHPLIEIGAHTATHPLLPALRPDLQRREIVSSKASLEKLLDQPVTSFSYPYGQFTEETRRIVCDVGFLCACSTRAEPVAVSADRFRLPRFAVPDCDGDEFARCLTRWRQPRPSEALT